MTSSPRPSSLPDTARSSLGEQSPSAQGSLPAGGFSYAEGSLSAEGSLTAEGSLSAEGSLAAIDSPSANSSSSAQGAQILRGDGGGNELRHVAIIMDGNNRWARREGLRSSEGHSRGAEVARDIVRASLKQGISYLTLFAFSSENWLRPEAEVRALMALFLRVMRRDEVAQFHADGVRIRFIGNRSSFSRSLQKAMAQLESKTANNAVMTVAVAVDYGGRWDIAQAAKSLYASLPPGADLDAAVTADALNAHLSSAQMPEPDLCIRTGGERRLSNFLLWQLAYAELYFCDIFWPDFTEQDLKCALIDFASRQRRFGGHSENVSDAANGGQHA